MNEPLTPGVATQDAQTLDSQPRDAADVLLLLGPEDCPPTPSTLPEGRAARQGRT